MNVINEKNAVPAAYWFLFVGNKVLVKLIDNRVVIPGTVDIKELEIRVNKSYHLGELKRSPCYAAEVADLPLPANYAFQGLRQLLGQVDEATFNMAGRGYQILHWEQTHKFCGVCGTPNQDKAGELAKECPQCGFITYPRISPAVIVAITKDNQLLLARNKKFPTDFYSVISGFVEPGETLEECIKREIKEEVGIEVKNIKYFGSQPWPFPDSLMTGFTAEYARGEIKVDNEEIVDAKWFAPDQLPNVAAKSTIARELIDWFLKG